MAETGNKSHKTEQVLIIEPKNVLHFKGPYTEVVTSNLTLTNPSDRKVCFKVKTTAPRRYCVRPNNGVVGPKSTTRIAVMLQPFDFENQPDRSKHKFMIQTMFEPEPEPDMDPENMWKLYPDQIMDSKLKCVFDNTSESAPVSDVGGGGGKDGGNIYSNAENAPELFSSQISESVKHSDDTVKPITEDSRSKEEMYRLMEENNSLRQELMQLKEDGLRKRFTNESNVASGDLPGFKGPSSIDVGSIDQMNLLAQPQVIGLILVALFLGLFLGKIIF